MAMDYHYSGVAIMLVVIIYLLALAWAVVQYVLTSLSLYTVAKRRGIPTPGLAWVPVASVWTLGAVSDQYDGTRGIQRKWRAALLTLAIIAYVCIFFGYIVMIAYLARMAMWSAYYSYTYSMSAEELFTSFGGTFVLLILGFIAAAGLGACQIVCRFKFFESCRPKDALKFLLLSILVPFAYPICMMCCRKYDLGMPQQPDYAPYLPQPQQYYAPQEPQQYYAPQQPAPDQPQQPQQYQEPQQPENNDPTPPPYNPYQ